MADASAADSCPVMTGQAAAAPTEALPVPSEPPGLSPQQLVPGIAPGLDVSPEVAD